MEQSNLSGSGAAKDIAIIADADTLLGFELVGVKDGIVFDEEKIKEDLRSVQDAKILIVTEKVATIIREKDLNVVPTLAEIPDKSGSSGHALEEISKLFESAIGVALKEEN